MNVLTTKYAAHKKGKARLLVATTSLRRRVYTPLICFANSFFFPHLESVFRAAAMCGEKLG